MDLRTSGFVVLSLILPICGQAKNLVIADNGDDGLTLRFLSQTTTKKDYERPVADLRYHCQPELFNPGVSQYEEEINSSGWPKRMYRVKDADEATTMMINGLASRWRTCRPAGFSFTRTPVVSTP